MEHHPITCRRCGTAYRVIPALLPACPNCGASPTPLWKQLRNNSVAAILALIALLVLMVSFLMPFMSMRAMGQENVYSMFEGIVQLKHEGYPILAGLILLFSVVFPICKVTLLLVSTSAMVNLSQAQRDRLHTFAVVTGKYSLLDVLVVAIMIVVVKLGDVVTVRAEIGTYLFCAGVLLSMAAGFCVRFPPGSEELKTT
ncbi:MAG: paraquat-inducible protein A [Phycisphaeraceae bacterium]|nr:paraquat-inducible protein A [Phycisphaeraceae bacterium]